MALSHDPDTTNKDPYYDDFDASKGYYRALFKPGTAVQARELTQIQTILQNQIESIGTHIFENGAVVAGGGIAESNVAAMRVDTTSSLSSANMSTIVGKSVSNGIVNAKILKSISGSTLPVDANQILVYQYTSNGVFAPDDVISTTDTSGITFSIASAGGCADAIIPNAAFVSVDQGVFYVDGFFVYNSPQNNSPFSISGVTNAAGDFRYRDFANPTASVGFRISKSTIDSEVDPTLKDPSSGFYNYNAPGADRYKVELTLDHIPFSGQLGDSSGLTFDTSSYFELLRMVGGVSTKTVKYTEYAEIEETLARRTFDESGNYTVNSPKIRITDHGDVFTPADTTKFAVGIEPNKSYVGGFEVDTQSTFFLEVDKTRDTAVVPDKSEFLNTPVGNYVLIDKANSGFGIGNISNFSATDSLDTFQTYNIYQDDSGFGPNHPTGQPFGTARVRSITRDTDGIKASLFDINLSGATAFNKAGYLVSSASVTLGGHTGSTGDFYKISAVNGITGPQDADQKSLIFPVKNPGLTSGLGIGQDASFVVRETSKLHLASGSNVATISMTDGKSLLGSDDEEFLVFHSATFDNDSPVELLDDDAYDATVINALQKNSTLRISGLTAGPVGGLTFCVSHPVLYDTNLYTGGDYQRTLTSTTATKLTVVSTTVVSRDGVQCAEFTLNNSHVYNVTGIEDAPTSGGVSDITSSISGLDYLDDGQRSSGYFISKVYVPTASLTALNGEYRINITYNYYAHTGVGPVTINSYRNAGIAYESMPSFTDPDSGIRFVLRDCVDFRPVQNSIGNFTNFGIPFYKNTGPLSKVGYQHFLPRIDTVTLCSDRSYRVVKGVSSVDPKAPLTTNDDMDLYHIKMKPYVFDVNTDITTKYIENRRYTMRDIGEIENSVENVERDRYLEVLQSDAIARGAAVSTQIIENSTMVDDFSTHAFADVSNRDHNCSMDYKDRGLRPAFEARGVDLTQNTLGTGLTMSPDRVVTYDYSTSNTFRGATGTGTLAVNPFGITDFLGFVKIEPKADFFYDTSQNPNVLVNEFGENNQYFITTRSWGAGKSAGFGGEDEEYLSHWLGTDDIKDVADTADPFARDYKSPVKGARAKLPDRILRSVGDKTVDESVIPYMRSVGVTFEATGMLPGSTVYAFFDSTSVGLTAGYTVNSTGAVSGYISVPATFLTGEKTFRLTDSNTDSVNLATTAADTKFFAQGLQNNKNVTIISDLPSESRRPSVNSSSVVESSFLDNQQGNFSAIQNGLDPLSQEIIVEAGTFPQGLFLESIDLFFKEKDENLPVTIQIRPMVNGSPHEFVSVPHSTVTATPVGSAGPNRSLNTNFKFSSPVYLPVGNWAVCVFSNSEKNVLYKSEVGQPFLLSATGLPNPESTTIDNLSTGAAGVRVGGLFLPLNNGSRVRSTNQSLMMDVNRCRFTGASSTSPQDRRVLFDCDFGGVSASANQLVIASNEQLFTSSSAFLRYDVFDNSDTKNPIDYIGVTPNKTLQLSKKVNRVSTDSAVQVQVLMSQTNSNDLSPVINMDRLGLIFADRKIDELDNQSMQVVGELARNGSGLGTRARYVSKRSNFGNTPATDMRVFLDIDPREGQVKVLTKVNASGDNFDEEPYIELAIQGIQTGGLKTYTFAPSADSLGSFTSYAIKIVLFAPDAPDGTPDSGLPVVKNLRSIAIR